MNGIELRMYAARIPATALECLGELAAQMTCPRLCQWLVNIVRQEQARRLLMSTDQPMESAMPAVDVWAYTDNELGDAMLDAFGALIAAPEIESRDFMRRVAHVLIAGAAVRLKNRATGKALAAKILPPAT
jgi:hypothetical protein